MSELQKTNTIPEDCPVPDAIAAVTSSQPSTNELLDAAIGYGDFDEALKKLQNGGERSLTQQEAAIIAGHTACKSCVFVDKCKEVAGDIQVNISPSASHPLTLIEGIDRTTQMELFAVGASVRAQEDGYTRESIANVLGKIPKLHEAMQKVILETMVTDPALIPTRLGLIDLNNMSYHFVEMGDVRLMISDQALKNLDDSEGNSRKSDFIDFLTDLFKKGRLQEALKGGNLRDINITTLRDGAGLEFDASAHSTLRGFGRIIGQNTQRYVDGDGDSLNMNTVLIPIIEPDAKGTGATERAKKRLNRMGISDLTQEDVVKSIEDSHSKKKTTKLDKKNR